MAQFLKSFHTEHNDPYTLNTSTKAADHLVMDARSQGISNHGIYLVFSEHPRCTVFCQDFARATDTKQAQGTYCGTLI